MNRFAGLLLLFAVSAAAAPPARADTPPPPVTISADSAYAAALQTPIYVSPDGTSTRAFRIALRWDPDTCLTCRDSRQHFAAGAGIDVATRLILPRTNAVQRLLIVGTIALAYELGQESASRAADVRGTGYGLGLKDLALGIAGASASELAWSGGRLLWRAVS